MLQNFRANNEWAPQLSKQDQAYYRTLIDRVFQDKNKLDDIKYPRTALYLPAQYRKEAMCEAQDGIFGGHNAAHKTYLKISRVWVKQRIYSPRVSTPFFIAINRNGDLLTLYAVSVLPAGGEG